MKEKIYLLPNPEREEKASSTGHAGDSFVDPEGNALFGIRGGKTKD